MANYTINDEISEMRRHFSEQLPNYAYYATEMITLRYATNLYGLSSCTSQIR